MKGMVGMDVVGMKDVVGIDAVGIKVVVSIGMEDMDVVGKVLEDMNMMGMNIKYTCIELIVELLIWVWHIYYLIDCL